MKEVNSYNLFLINQLGSWEISKEVFLAKTSFKADFEQLNYLLDLTANKCDSENNNSFFEAIFWHVPKSISSKQKEDVYRKYLLRNWHHEHEEIAGTFQSDFNSNPLNIETLLKAIENIPYYLQDNNLKYPYIRKIIYAIGAQPEPDNIIALESLSKSEDEKIQNLALHQIEKRKRLGRWEAAKNVQ